MSSKKEFYSRKFLNKKGHHSTAFIFGEIIKNLSRKTSKKKLTTWYDVDLKISDCDRVITLFMDVDTKRNCKNSLRKLDIMIKFLTEFKRAIQKIHHEKDKK